MHLAICYSYRGDDTVTYKLSSDHSLAPSWKYKVSDVDNTKVLSLEGALKLGLFSKQRAWWWKHKKWIDVVPDESYYITQFAFYNKEGKLSLH